MFIKDIRPLYSCNDSIRVFPGRGLMKPVWIRKNSLFKPFLQKSGLVQKYKMREIKGIPYEAVLDGQAVAEF